MACRAFFVFIMPKTGFNDQWIQISRTGKFNDSEGTERDLNADFLNKVVANFEANNSPITIGHPDDNAPAWGWTVDLRMNNGVMEARFADTDDEFEQMVQDGKFRKRSASFYLDPPRLKHVGFLGAAPPAVKGLRDIQFSDGDSVTVEISFSEENKTMKEEEEKVAESFFGKLFMNFMKGKSDSPSIINIPGLADQTAPASTANFSETDMKKMISEAIAENTKTLTAEFNEKYNALESKVGSMSGKGRRAEIDAFVDSIPAESGKHYLKNIGVASFLEALAVADDNDTEGAVICFSEADGKKEEHKFSRFEWAKTYFSNLPKTISFGEKFGNLSVTAEVQETVEKNPARVSSMKGKMGIPVEGGAK